MHLSRAAFVGLLLSLTAPAPLNSQAPASPPPSVSAPLADFEGLYDYRDGATLYMVARDQQLFAVIGESKYLLRPSDRDTFLNGSGDAIPFTRDGSGRVVAFTERGDKFARRSPSVPNEVRALFIPRPRGPDGAAPLYRYTPPPALADGLDVGRADAAGLSPALAERVVNGITDATFPEVRSILVYHRNRLVIEEYFYGYDRDRPHQMRSLTKSVVALLAGVAVDRGLLRADEPVLTRLGYPAYANPDPRKARITLVDILSNQSGLACDDHDGRSPGNESKLYETADWPKAFVDLPMLADPGTVGRYCSGGFFTTGRIIERAAGKPLAEFADEALLSPLGLRRQDWKWNFTLDRSQRDEFGQIYLRPRDMLKLGLLIQQRGVWRGRRVVSASWIEKAIAAQSRVDDSDYGLGIWHRWYAVKTKSGDRRVDTIMLSGNGGQKVYLVPSQDLIVVFTGGAFNIESPVNEIMARVLLPALVETTGVIAQTPPLNLTLKTNSPLEQRKKSQIERLATTYDLKKYTLTRDIVIEQGATPHSRPVLTLNGRFLDDDDRALSQYVHEQAHWVLGERHKGDMRNLFRDLSAAFPRLPTEPPQGSAGVQDSYFHLAVIMLEWQALEQLVGASRAKTVEEFKQGDHYTALYATVLEHRATVEGILRRYGIRW